MVSSSGSHPCIAGLENTEPREGAEQRLLHLARATFRQGEGASLSVHPVQTPTYITSATMAITSKRVSGIRGNLKEIMVDILIATPSLRRHLIRVHVQRTTLLRLLIIAGMIPTRHPFQQHDKSIRNVSS